MKYDFDKFCNRYGTCSVKYDFAEKNGKRPDIMPFWIADMDIRTSPEIVEAIKSRADHGIFGYTMPKEEYFGAVSAWFKKRHGCHLEPENFVCTPGVVFAINTLIRAMTKEGEGVMICQPVYYPFENSIKYNKRKLVVSPLKNEDGYYTYDFDDIERQIVNNDVKLFIQCSPHNPVGRVWTRAELEKIAEICLKHGVFVISDEIHCDFVYDDNRHTVFATLNDEIKKHCAVCTSPSKSFNLAGLQISNIYIPDRGVRKKFEDELDKIGYWEPNIMGLTACHAAYTKGEDWFLSVKNYLRENMYFVQERLKRDIPSVKFRMPQGTYLLWLDCRSLGLGNEDLRKLFEEKAGLWMDDGYIFGSSGSGYERLNVACPKSSLECALAKLKTAVDKI